MKKKFIVLAIVFSLILGSGAIYAWNAGYCEVAGCHCHQYYGGDGAHDKCTTCGHEKAQHS
jgi:hypothetical protein